LRGPSLVSGSDLVWGLWVEDGLTKAKVGRAEGRAGARENPLVPYRRMREMYLAMAGARLLDEWMMGQGRRGGLGVPVSTRGEEACRVSTLIGLERGDLVVDPMRAVTTDYLLGASGKSLARAGVAEAGVGLDLADGRRGRRLDVGGEADGEEAMMLAVGAALAVKAQRATRVLVAYAAADAMSAETRVLGMAARAEAPVMFVVLPGRAARPGVLSARATRLGVPGIAVEADDAVGLYRVAQESVVRMRMGGGPVLMECVRLGRRQTGQGTVDTLEQMRQVLLAKGAADEQWVERAEARLGTRLLGQLAAGREKDEA
jgi:TPP-dependent pyruvate/acetoin dehydrogenase alpha subunit